MTDFVRHMNPLGVLNARDLAEPLDTSPDQALEADADIREVLEAVTQSEQPIGVSVDGGLELDVRPSDLQDYGDLLIVSGTTSGPGFSGNWLEVMKKNPAGPLPYRIYRLSFIEI